VGACWFSQFNSDPATQGEPRTAHTTDAIASRLVRGVRGAGDAYDSRTGTRRWE